MRQPANAARWLRVGVCAIATLALLAARPPVGEANHASVSSQTQAVAFLVNGYGGCCIPGSVGAWLGGLKDDTGAPIVQVHESNWNQIDQGGNPGAFPFGGFPDPFTDDGFVEDMRQAVEQLDAQHPGLELIVVGHSFGGDAVLEVAKAIRPRRIAMLAVLDPVGRAGLRTNVTHPVPGNVEYLYDRWQTNAPYPLDFLRSGRLSSSARESDQHAQSIRRDSKCRIKYVDQLHVFPELMLHAQMPKDSCVQAQLKRILLSRVFNPNPRVSGGAIVLGGVIVEGVRVAFSEAIDPATFTLDDVVSASVTPTGIESLPGTGNREFIVRFTPVVVPPRARPLRLVVGPTILDVDGNPMDQDRDLVPGEAVQDRYTFEYGAGGAQPPIKLPRVVALESILGLEGRIRADRGSRADLRPGARPCDRDRSRELPTRLSRRRRSARHRGRPSDCADLGGVQPTKAGPQAHSADLALPAADVPDRGRGLRPRRLQSEARESARRGAAAVSRGGVVKDERCRARGTAALRALARRALGATAEAAAHERALADQLALIAPELLREHGVGPVTGAQLVISWPHPGRIRSEAAFARLGRVAPIPASSGRVVRHRLDRGGDRQLSRALHTIVLVRKRSDPATGRRYLARRTVEGKSGREANRMTQPLRMMHRRLLRGLARYPRTRDRLAGRSRLTPWTPGASR